MAHGVQAFGELDQHHAQIFGDGEQHLAQTFGVDLLLLALVGLVGQILCDRHTVHAIDQARDAGAELLFDADRINCSAAAMQYRRCQCFVIHAHFTEDLCHAKCIPDCAAVGWLCRVIIGQCLAQHGKLCCGAARSEGCQPGIELRVVDGGVGGLCVCFGHDGVCFAG